MAAGSGATTDSTPSRRFEIEIPAGSVYPSEAWPTLTQEEEQLALETGIPVLLKEAQKQKNTRIEREKHAAKVAQLTYVPETPEKLLDEVSKRAQALAQREFWRDPFAYDKDNTGIYVALSAYFMGLESFETEGPSLLGTPNAKLSLNKGLLLFGNRGVGKTVLMELFAHNPYQPFLVIPCTQIEREFEKDGVEVIDRYSNRLIVNDPGRHYGHKTLGYCFDDLGNEADGKHYGKTLNVMERILEDRYRHCRGPLTHLTTNGEIEQLEKAYGERVYDRMVQMFNLIQFPKTAKSRRR